MNICLGVLLSLVLHVHAGESINAALDSARVVYAQRGERTTILLEPGVYQEQLTIDIPGLPAIEPIERVKARAMQKNRKYYFIVKDGARVGAINVGKKLSYPEEDCLYISPLFILPEYTARPMPERPKQVGSTEVQWKQYRERAAAISFTETAKNAHLKNCTAVGRQDVVYGDQGATIYWERGVLAGGVDFIFGAMTMVVDHAIIIANITDEEGEKCYISAGRSEQGSRGLLFYHCYIRSPKPESVWLARPWRWWGETVWAYTRWDKGVLNPEGWHTGLVRKKEGYNPENPCPFSYEYKSQDGSIGRPKWVTVLRKPTLPDGTRLKPKDWLK